MSALDDLLDEHIENCTVKVNCVVKAFNAMIKRNPSDGLLRISPENYRAWLEIAKPSVFLLHSAAWRAGYAVNGIAP